jgi:hypothetical protein
MKSQALKFIFLIILSSLLMFILTYSEIWKANSIYWLIPFWLISLFFVFRLWEINFGKLILALHVLVLLSGLFSFISYQLFKKLSDVTPFSSSNFTNVSNLMFNSENALYLLIYGGVFLLLLDSIYFLRYLKK